MAPKPSHALSGTSRLFPEWIAKRSQYMRCSRQERLLRLVVRVTRALFEGVVCAFCPYQRVAHISRHSPRSCVL
jgi:hypothetical protein